MATYTDQGLFKNAVSPYGNVNSKAGDNVVSNADWSIANLLIPGDLEVQGTTTSVNSEQLNIKDAGILINSNYTSVTATEGAVVTVVVGSVTADTVSAAGFTAGVDAASNPTVGTVGASTFAAGDLILIVGSNTVANDGIYEALSHAANVLTIRGVGITARVESWSQNQFTTDATVGGTVTKVTVAVMQAGTDGVWETGTGDVTPISYADVGTGTGNDLQAAYDLDGAIVTSGGSGTVSIGGTEDFVVNTTGLFNLDSALDADVSSFDVLSSGAISLDAGAASNLSVDNATLTVETTTAGTLSVQSAGALDMDGTTFTLDATGTGSISGTSVLVDATFGALTLVANTDVDMDGQQILIDGTETSNFTITATEATTQTLTLSATNAGAGGANVVIAADNTIDVDSTAFDLDTTSTIALDSPTITGTATLAATFQSSGTGSTTIDAGSGGLDLLSDAGVEMTAVSGTVDINATSSVTIDASAGGISLDGAGTSNFTTSSGNLSVTANAGSVTLNSSTATQVNAGTFDVNSTNAITIDSSAAGFSIDGVTASNISTTTGDLTLSTTTGGDVVVSAGFSGSVNVTSSGDSSYTVPNASATAWTLSDGTDDFIIVDSTAGNEKLKVGQFLTLAKGAGLEIVTAVALSEGNVCYINASGEAALADSDAGTLREAAVFGVSNGTFAGSATASMVTVPGSLVPVRFVSAPAGADNGKFCWLSPTAGQVTLTPTVNDDNVGLIIGQLVGADGADTTPNVIFQPSLQNVGANVT